MQTQNHNEKTKKKHNNRTTEWRQSVSKIKIEWKVAKESTEFSTERKALNAAYGILDNFFFLFRFSFSFIHFPPTVGLFGLLL